MSLICRPRLIMLSVTRERRVAAAGEDCGLHRRDAGGLPRSSSKPLYIASGLIKCHSESQEQYVVPQLVWRNSPLAA